MEAVVTLGKKRSSTVPSTDYSLCVVCQRKDGGKTQNVKSTGYGALLYAVKHRGDEVAARLCSDLENEDKFIANCPKIHASCRSSYTNKKTVDSLFKRLMTGDNESSSTDCSNAPSQMKTRASTSLPKKWKNICFLCERTRDKKGCFGLISVATQNRQQIIWEKAKELNDTIVLHKIEGFGETCIDMIANDFKYHTRCLDNFRSRKPDTKSRQSEPHDVAFQKLISEIHEPLFKDHAIFFINRLRDRYKSLLSESGVQDADKYQTRYLRNRLEKYYEDESGCRVMIVMQPGTSNLLCSSDISAKDLFSEIKRLQQLLIDDDIIGFDSEENDTRSQEYQNEHDQQLKLMSYHSAKSLRFSLKEYATQRKNRVTSTPDASEKELEISPESASEMITENLYNHLAWLLTDVNTEHKDRGRVKITPKQNEQVINIAQDIIAAVTGLPTPKQVGTALHLLRVNRNRETITMLNRLGNCISYNDAQRYVASMTRETQGEIDTDGFFTPSNMTSGRFTHFAIDNLDFHEHTRDGTTLHATTHNVYQYKEADNVSLKQTNRVPLVKSRSMSVLLPECTPIADSKVSLKDRQKARSLEGVSILQEENVSPSQTCHRELLRQLTRICPTSLINIDEVNFDFICPTWNVFNERMITQVNLDTTIGYGSIFPRSPTSPAVVESSIDYCFNMAAKLGQKFTIVTCDQAIYDIALALQKQKPEKYKNLILRMGGFHIASNYMGAIGHLMKSTGIEDILVESHTCLRGTANKIMAGKDYYLMLRAHRFVADAMFELYWESFEQWLHDEEKDVECFSTISSHIQELMLALKADDAIKANDVLMKANDYLKNVTVLMDEFQKSQCVSPTSRLWLMYIDMVAILNRYIYAERSGCWEAHLKEARNMLPYLVAAGHYKYVSCLPHYLEAMESLPAVAPEVDSAFKSGKFTVHKTSKKFNGVWTDMALEQTYNCDAKTRLFHGISQQQATMMKYLTVAPRLTAISGEVKRMVHLDRVNEKHHEDTRTMAVEHINATAEIKNVIKAKMVDPFTYTGQDLINISTGQKAASQDLVNAREIGISALKKAQETSSATVDKVKITTFETKGKRKKSAVEQAKSVLAEESTVSRNLYFVDGLNEEDKKETFKHEWTSYPSSLFQPNAAFDQGYVMRKGSKADFINGMRKFLGDDWPAQEFASSTGYDGGYIMVVDAMAFIKRFQQFRSKTFFDLQANYLNKLLDLRPAGCNVIHFVGDRYDVGELSSLKGEEREKRTKGKSSKEYDPQDALQIPDWDLFMMNPKNKANLLNYLGKAWESQHSNLPQGVRVIIGGCFRDPGRTLELTTERVAVIPELSCTHHEEADTRMFAHVSYSADLNHRRVVIFATDTDVIILGMYYVVRIPGLTEIWIQKINIALPLHAIVAEISKKSNIPKLDLTAVILAIYVLTGCDTVSYLYRKGKRTALAIALNKGNSFMALGEYGKPGEATEITEEVIEATRQFICALYGRYGFSGSLDDLRAHLFASKRADMRHLPPTEDAFAQHLLRSANQIIINKQAHLSNTNYPDPTLFGRKIVNGKLVPIMMLKEPKPQAAVQQKPCRCREVSRCLSNCKCAKNNVKCTIACLCTGDPEKCGHVAYAFCILRDGEDD